MRTPKSLNTTEGLRKLRWHVLRMVDDENYGQPANDYGRFSVWDIYRLVAYELKRSIRIAKEDGKKTGKRFIDREIKDIVKWLKE